MVVQYTEDFFGKLAGSIHNWMLTRKGW